MRPFQVSVLEQFPPCLNVGKGILIMTFRIVIFTAIFCRYFSEQSVVAEVTNEVDEDDILASAFTAMIGATTTRQVLLVYDDQEDERFIGTLTNLLFDAAKLVYTYKLESSTNQTLALEITRTLKMPAVKSSAFAVITNTDVLENFVSKILENSVVSRRTLYMFFWNGRRVSHRLRGLLHEVISACVITRLRRGVYQVYFNQAKPAGEKRLHLVNWWTQQRGLFRTPLLPQADKVYSDFGGRLFRIPVLHKPPWNFVVYDNDSIRVEGGRDVKLLEIISSKLNFRFEYFDPPERSEGSVMANGTVTGILNLIMKRETEFFSGDVTVTYERNCVVEFSFFTLADSEAFLTHAPSKLNEALALVRPFDWKVWIPVVLVLIVCGPLLCCLTWASSLRCSMGEVPAFSDLKLFRDCVWLTTAIFLKQNTKIPLKMKRTRILVAVLYLIATYVVGGMYSANLTSMLARPAREKPVRNLQELLMAMIRGKYQLLVERQSASHSLLQNGTGLYKAIWDAMSHQEKYLLNSIEEGMHTVKKNQNSAVIGGRETFFYNIRRLGAHNFYLSDKLYTRYSAIAFQTGCPFVESFNKIIVALFEAGILSKISEEEYYILGQNLKNTDQEKLAAPPVVNTNNSTLQPINMKTLQGAFFILLIGLAIAGFKIFGSPSFLIILMPNDN